MFPTSLLPLAVAQLQRLPSAGYLTEPLAIDKIQRVLHEHFGHPTATA